MISIALLCSAAAQANGLRVLDRAAKEAPKYRRRSPAALVPVVTHFKPCIKPNTEGVAVLSMCPVVVPQPKRKPAAQPKKPQARTTKRRAKSKR